MIALLLFVVSLSAIIYGSYLYGIYSRFDAVRYKNRIDSVNSVLKSKLVSEKMSKAEWKKITNDLHEFPKAAESKHPDTVIVTLLPDGKTEKIIALHNKLYSDTVELNKDLKKSVTDPRIYNYNPGHFLEPDDSIADNIVGVGVILFLVSMTVFIILSFLNANEKEQSRYHSDLVKAREGIEKNPDKVMPAWDMAQLTLEQYFQRNLRQINMIFYTSIGVMLAGFILIAAGAFFAFKSEEGEAFVHVLTASSGILTEFIGATFIFIYNSTIKQAMGYTDSLEKINSVGMSIKILDNIQLKETESDKLNDAKIEIAKILLQSKLPKPGASSELAPGN